jgi:hypothetical protein
VQRNRSFHPGTNSVVPAETCTSVAWGIDRVPEFNQ